MKHYLDEELVVNERDFQFAYLRVGSSAEALLLGEEKVNICFFFSFTIAMKLNNHFVSIKIKFTIQKNNFGKVAAGQDAARFIGNLEFEQLEEKCYHDLLDCCKKIASEVGVAYTTIMNVQVRIFPFNLPIKLDESYQ